MIIPKRWKRAIDFFIQRRIRGFDDSETWSLDYSLACLILPRLQRYRNIIIDSSIIDEMEVITELDKMIIAFDIIANDPDYYALEAYPEKLKAVNEGLDLFHANYRNLWW